MISSPQKLLTLAVALAGIPAVASGALQQLPTTAGAPPTSSPPAAPPPSPAGDQPASEQGGGRATVPFAVGEQLNYDVHFGPIRAGSGSMEVRGIETVRGKEAYHTVFQVRGGIPFYRVHDVFESWFDTSTLASLKFVQDQDEGPKERERHYEIFPSRRCIASW